MQSVKGENQPKVVVTIHDVIPLLYPEHYPVGIRGKVGFWLQKQALKNVSAIITDSETSKKDIHRYLEVPLHKIVSVPLAGNPEIHKVSSTKVIEARKKYKLPERYILYVGDINYNKNIPELIRSINQVKTDIHLVCVGANFKPQHIPEWENIESSLKSVRDRVVFLNSVQKGDNEALSAIYSGANAYIQPSLYEGFGLPLLEAMQAGTIVVSSDTPALKEIGGKGVIFSHPSAKALANGINTALNLSDHERRRRLELNAQTVNTFTWFKAASDTVQVYKSVL